jgi:hypothetical protein
MSYCRNPIYIIKTCHGNINCFDVNDFDPKSKHHHGFWSDPYKNEQQVYDHMKWHVSLFEAEAKYDEADLLKSHIVDLMAMPYYTKWYHRLDPWRWLFWRRYYRVYDWLEDGK